MTLGSVLKTANDLLPPGTKKKMILKNPVFWKIVIISLAIIIVIVIIVVMYFFIKDQIDKATEFGRIFNDVGTPLKCPPAYPNSTGLLCNQACPKNMKWDGAQLCLGSVPPYWTGNNGNKDSPTDLLRDNKDNGIGVIDGLACAPGQEKYAGLCYDLRSGEAVTTPGFVGQKCESSVTDSGTSCYYALPVGTIPGIKTESTPYYNYSPGCGTAWVPCWDDSEVCKSDCYRTKLWKLNTFQYCPPGEEEVLGLCYPKCRSGYSHILGHCSKPKNIRSVIGTIPKTCTPDKQYLDGLCYNKCSRHGKVTNWDGSKQDKYELDRSWIFSCLEKCPPGYKTTGALTCMKPSEFLPVAKGVAEVGICGPNEDKIGLLCYPKKKK